MREQQLDTYVFSGRKMQVLFNQLGTAFNPLGPTGSSTGLDNASMWSQPCRYFGHPPEHHLCTISFLYQF